MTTELDQEFFNVFGVEPKNKCGKDLIYPNCLNPDKCGYDSCIYYQIEYPDITAEKLLEMICINSYFCGVNFHNLWVKNPDELKAIILDEIIRWYKEQKYGHEKCKQQIQQLFKD